MPMGSSAGRSAHHRVATNAKHRATPRQRDQIDPIFETSEARLTGRAHQLIQLGSALLVIVLAPLVALRSDLLTGLLAVALGWIGYLLAWSIEGRTRR